MNPDEVACYSFTFCSGSVVYIVDMEFFFKCSVLSGRRRSCFSTITIIPPLIQPVNNPKNPQHTPHYNVAFFSKFFAPQTRKSRFHFAEIPTNTHIYNFQEGREKTNKNKCLILLLLYVVCSFRI